MFLHWWNITLADTISADPSAKEIFDTFSTWSQSSEYFPDLTGFHTEAIWNMMQFAKDDVVVTYSRYVADAFEYLLEHPQIHKTSC